MSWIENQAQNTQNIIFKQVLTSQLRASQNYENCFKIVHRNRDRTAHTDHQSLLIVWHHERRGSHLVETILYNFDLLSSAANVSSNCEIVSYGNDQLQD